MEDPNDNQADISDGKQQANTTQFGRIPNEGGGHVSGVNIPQTPHNGSADSRQILRGDEKRLMKVNDPRRGAVHSHHPKAASPRHTLNESPGVEDEDSSFKTLLAKLIMLICTREIQKYENELLMKQQDLIDRDKQIADRSQIKGPYREQLNVKSADIRRKLEAKRSKLDQLKMKQSEYLEAVTSELAQQSNRLIEKPESSYSATVNGTNARCQVLEAKIESLSKDVSINKTAIASKDFDALEAKVDLIKNDMENFVSKQYLSAYITEFNQFRQSVREDFQSLKTQASGSSRNDQLESLKLSLTAEIEERKELASSLKSLADPTQTRYVEIAQINELRAQLAEEKNQRAALSKKVDDLSAEVSNAAGGRTVLESHSQQLKKLAQEDTARRQSMSKQALDGKRISEEIQNLKEGFEKKIGILEHRHNACEHTIRALNSRYNNLSSESLVRQMASILDQNSSGLKNIVAKLQLDVRTLQEAGTRDDTVTPQQMAHAEKLVTDATAKVDQFQIKVGAIEKELAKTHAANDSQAFEDLRTMLLQEMRDSHDKLNTAILQDVSEKHETTTKASKQLADKIGKVQNDFSKYKEDMLGSEKASLTDIDRLNEVCSALSKDTNKVHNLQQELLKRLDDIEKLQAQHANRIEELDVLKKELSNYMEKAESSREELSQHIGKVDTEGTERHTTLVHEVLTAKKNIEDRLDGAEHHLDKVSHRIEDIAKGGIKSAQLGNSIDSSGERKNGSLLATPITKSRQKGLNPSNSTNKEPLSSSSRDRGQAKLVSTPRWGSRQEISETEDSSTTPIPSFQRSAKASDKTIHSARKDKNRSGTREIATTNNDAKIPQDVVYEKEDAAVQGDTITVALNPVTRAFGSNPTVDLTQDDDDDSEELAAELPKWKPRLHRQDDMSQGSRATPQKNLASGTPKGSSNSNSSTSSKKRKKEAHRNSSLDSPPGSAAKKSRVT